MYRIVQHTFNHDFNDFPNVNQFTIGKFTKVNKKNCCFPIVKC